MQIRKKEIKINSITDPDSRRILKPCEARAGHGAIAMFLGVAVIAGILFVLIKLGKKLFEYIF
jgi:hypothetical protein